MVSFLLSGTRSIVIFFRRRSWRFCLVWVTYESCNLKFSNLSTRFLSGDHTVLWFEHGSRFFVLLNTSYLGGEVKDYVPLVNLLAIVSAGLRLRLLLRLLSNSLTWLNTVLVAEFIVLFKSKISSFLREADSNNYWDLILLRFCSLVSFSFPGLVSSCGWGIYYRSIRRRRNLILTILF